MKGLIETAAIALLNSWLSRPRAPAGAALKGLWLLGLSAFLAIGGLVYLLIAFNIWLTALYGPLYAALGTALSAFMLSGFAALAFSSRHEKGTAKQPQADPLVETAQSVITTLDALTAGLDGPVAENPRSAVAMASLAGYVAAEKFG